MRAWCLQYLLFGTLKKTSLSCLPWSSLWSLTALNSSWHTAICRNKKKLQLSTRRHNTHTHNTEKGAVMLTNTRKRDYRVNRRNIGDPFPFSTAGRGRRGDIVQISPSTRAARRRSGSSPLSTHWHHGETPPATKQSRLLCCFVLNSVDAKLHRNGGVDRRVSVQVDEQRVDRERSVSSMKQSQQSPHKQSRKQVH